MTENFLLCIVHVLGSMGYIIRGHHAGTTCPGFISLCRQVLIRCLVLAHICTSSLSPLDVSNGFQWPRIPALSPLLRWYLSPGWLGHAKSPCRSIFVQY